MTRRLLLGKAGSDYGLFVSKAGTDVTKHFKWHSDHAKQLWALYKIGEIGEITMSCCCFH